MCADPKDDQYQSERGRSLILVGPLATATVTLLKYYSHYTRNIPIYSTLIHSLQPSSSSTCYKNGPNRPTTTHKQPFRYPHLTNVLPAASTISPTQHSNTPLPIHLNHRIRWSLGWDPGACQLARVCILRACGFVECARYHVPENNGRRKTHVNSVSSAKVRFGIIVGISSSGVEKMFAWPESGQHCH